MYKNLLFDLDNTLLDFDKAEDMALEEFLSSLNVKDIQSYKAYYIKMNRQLWLDLEQNKITREELVNTRFHKLFHHFKIEVDGKELAEKYKVVLGKQGAVLEGAKELLEALYSRYNIYIATNGITYIQNHRLENSGLLPYIKDVFISEDIGYLKPEVQFFEYIENKIVDFNKEETLMIGDNLFADIYGGNNFGIDTVYYNPLNKPLEKDILPKYQISGYNELLKILL